MSLFLSRLNKTATITGLTQTGTDGGGQPIFTESSKGTVRCRIWPKTHPDEVNGPDLNPTISEYEAVIENPSGFTVTPADKLAASGLTYEILSAHPQDGRSVSHHWELDLRRVV